MYSKLADKQCSTVVLGGTLAAAALPAADAALARVAADIAAAAAAAAAVARAVIAIASAKTAATATAAAAAAAAMDAAALHDEPQNHRAPYPLVGMAVALCGQGAESNDAIARWLLY